MHVPTVTARTEGSSRLLFWDGWCWEKFTNNVYYQTIQLLHLRISIKWLVCVYQWSYGWTTRIATFPVFQRVVFSATKTDFAPPIRIEINATGYRPKKKKKHLKSRGWIFARSNWSVNRSVGTCCLCVVSYVIKTISVQEMTPVRCDDQHTWCMVLNSGRIRPRNEHGSIGRPSSFLTS